MPKTKYLTTSGLPREGQGDISLQPLAYRVPDAARVLGVGKTSLYELFKTGELTPIRIAGRTLVPADQIRRLITTAPAALNNN